MQPTDLQIKFHVLTKLGRSPIGFEHANIRKEETAYKKVAMNFVCPPYVYIYIGLNPKID